MTPRNMYEVHNVDIIVPRLEKVREEIRNLDYSLLSMIDKTRFNELLMQVNARITG